MNNLESLANELFLYLFEHFNDIHLIRAFYGLNSRFNQLLCSHFRPYYFDFRSIYKKDFDFICQEYLPSIMDRIISLHLSDVDDTPEQFNLFLSFIPSFEQFIQLRSLSLNLHYPYLIDKVISQLPNLTHLNISTCFFNLDPTYTINLIDIIWSLSKLIYCKLENVIPYEILLSAPTIHSTSLQYLIINNLSRNLFELARLCEYTPSLQYLEISIWDSHSTVEIPFEFQWLNKLKLSFQGSSHVLTNILKSMPNLTCLKIRTQRIILNGYQWEQIIEDYLLNLKIFQFFMQFSFLDYSQNEDEFFQSFQTQFWLEKHEWFIQCHWNPHNDNRLRYFYTLPYFFDSFIYQNNMRFKSTCPDSKHNGMYNRVHSLLYGVCISKEIFLYHPLDFSNIRNLHIDLPFNDHFWSIVPAMNQLMYLDIERFNNNKAQCQLQSLLDRAPNLYSLTFKSSYFSSKLLFELKCSTIRRLNLYESNHWFNKQQCLALINSSFGKQCEILFIKIKKRSNILQLVTKINQLRTLIFQCEDDQWETEENHLMEWLDHHLPSTCSIKRDANKLDIRLWIR